MVSGWQQEIPGWIPLVKVIESLRVRREEKTRARERYLALQAKRDHVVNRVNNYQPPQNTSGYQISFDSRGRCTGTSFTSNIRAINNRSG